MILKNILENRHLRKKLPFIIATVFSVFAGSIFINSLTSAKNAEKELISQKASAMPSKESNIKTGAANEYSKSSHMENTTEELVHNDELSPTVSSDSCIDKALAKGGVIPGLHISDVLTNSLQYTEYDTETITLQSEASSGSFQLANLFMTLPCRVSDLTENGVSIIRIEKNLNFTTEDRKIEKGSHANVILYYKGCLFSGTVRNFDDKPQDLLEADLTSVTEDRSISSERNNINHIICSGGIKVGSERESMLAVLKEPDNINKGAIPGENIDQYFWGTKAEFFEISNDNYINCVVNKKDNNIMQLTICRTTH